MRLGLILVLTLALGVLNTRAVPFSLEADEEDDLGFDMDDDHEDDFYLGEYNNNDAYDEDEALSDAIPMTSDMSCYECKEDESGSFQCDLEQHEIILAAINEELTKAHVQHPNEDDQAADRDIYDAGTIEYFFRSISRLNPCRIMTGRILKLMNSQEIEQNHLLPFFLDLTGKDQMSQYEELKSAVSTIQFQKRQNSDWMTVEVQMRNSEEPFSFILSDLGHELLVVPDNSIFYTAL